MPHRLLFALLACFLLLPLAACDDEDKAAQASDPDDPKTALLGDWVGDFGGQTLTLSFAADGSLTMTDTAKKSASGTWALKDGKLELDLRDATGRAEVLSCAYAITEGLLRLSGEDKDCTEAPDLKKQGS